VILEDDANSSFKSMTNHSLVYGSLSHRVNFRSIAGPSTELCFIKNPILMEMA